MYRLNVYRFDIFPNFIKYTTEYLHERSDAARGPREGAERARGFHQKVFVLDHAIGACQCSTFAGAGDERFRSFLGSAPRGLLGPHPRGVAAGDDLADCMLPCMARAALGVIFTVWRHS